MKPRLDMDRLAKALGAERRGRLPAKSGYFGAVELAEQARRLRAPATGGRSTDPAWTERRLIPLAPGTLATLEQLSEALQEKSGVTLEPMQIAALLLEHAAELVSDEETAELAERARGGERRRTGRRG